MGKHLIQSENKEKRGTKLRKKDAPIPVEINEADAEKKKRHFTVRKGIGSGKSGTLISAILLAVVPFCPADFGGQR